ncbi:PA3715 family protein [Myroides sp. LJL116]
MRLNIIVIFLFFSTFSFSQIKDPSLLEKVLTELQLKENEIHIDLVVDKVLPYSKDKTVIAIPKYRSIEVSYSGNESYQFDALIVVVENKSGKILNKFYDSNAWFSGAITLESIEIDTGLYLLNEQTRAFGIRINLQGSSRVTPYSTTELSLFIPEDNQLKRVLKNYPVKNYRGDWDMNCRGEFESTTSYIDIGKTKSNGLYNLIVKGKTNIIKNIPTEDDCIEESYSSQQVTTLKYNGDIYQ